MNIIFQSPIGTRFSAVLIDDKLTNITELDSTPPTSGGATSSGGTEPAKGESQQGEGESKGDESQSEPPIPEDRVFIERLRSVLVNNRARKQLRNRQKGSLDLKALVRTQTNSMSVFRQNNRKDSQRNYSVVLLVDESGSMTGSKAVLAKELATNVSSNLEKVGGVEVAVLGFSGNRIVEHKRFDNTGRSSTCCIDKFANRSHHCDIGKAINSEKDSDLQNADLIAMEYSLKYLVENQAPNSRPIFIMLSDGAPCSSPRSIAVITADQRTETFNSRLIGEGLKDSSSIDHMHRLLLRYPDVNAFGLGMLCGGQQVPKHKVVKDIKETKGVLLDFLRTSIN